MRVRMRLLPLSLRCPPTLFLCFEPPVVPAIVRLTVRRRGGGKCAELEQQRELASRTLSARTHAC